MSTSPEVLEVAVVGVGRMGRHHVRTYGKLPEAKLVAVVDADAARAAAVAQEVGCRAYTSVAELLTEHPRLAAASVAVPTAAHVAAATPLLEERVACLVEKPLANNRQHAQALVETAHRHNTVLQVGHTERFNPALRALQAMKVTPRFIEVHRVSPMTFRSLDVSVVMDVMIHDLDIVLMLADSPLDRVEAVGVAVLGEHEDVANARLVFASGCVANLTASRLALKTERKMRIFAETAYISLDYQKRNGIVIRKTSNDAAIDNVRQKLAAGSDMSGLDYSELVQLEKLRMDLPEGQDDPLTAELTSFLTAVRGQGPVAVDGLAGLAAVDAAQRVQEAMAGHQWEGLDWPARES